MRDVGDVVPAPVDPIVLRTGGHRVRGDTAGGAQGATQAEIVALAPTILATARLLLRNEHDAHDLAQTTMEIGFRQLGALRDPAKLRPWLLAIEAHEASKLRRRLRAFVSLDGHVDPITAPGMDDRAIELRRAVATLPTRMRAVVVLHHMVGLSVAETARAMRTSENTVKSELRTGLVRMRKVMGDRNE